MVDIRKQTDCHIETDDCELHNMIASDGIGNCHRLLSDNERTGTKNMDQDDNELVQNNYGTRKRLVKIIMYSVVIILYHAYFVAAMLHDFQKAAGLIVFTSVAWLFVFYYYAYDPYLSHRMNTSFCRPSWLFLNKMWQVKQVKWMTYGCIALAIIAFLAVDTANNRYRLVSLAGLSAFLLIGFLFSSNRSQITWRPIVWGLLTQFVMGLFVFRWPPGLLSFLWLSKRIVKFLDYTYVGTSFAYGFLSDPPDICGMSPVLVFSTLQVIVFFGSVVAVLYYYGIIQWLLIRMATAMEYTMGTTAAESMYAASSIFLGQSEAVLVIRPYLSKLTKSELHQLLTSGFASIAGAMFATYTSFGACPVYLLSASIMSAPASLAASKLFYPETEKSHTKYVKDLQLPKGEETNVIEAIANGACNVTQIIVVAVASLIVFQAGIALMNDVVWWMGEMVGVEGITFELIYSYVFFPLAFLMGASDNPIWERKVQETMAVAELIGTKTILNEFIAYKKMGEFVVQGKIGARAQMIATYALCGYANIGSVGIQVAFLGALCPEKKHIIPQIALRALVAGSVSCFLTACLAGLLISNPLDCQPSLRNENCFNATAHI